jgi:hypothetical protein
MTLVTQLYLPLTIILFGSSLLLHLLPRLGKPGKELSDSLCYAPFIDLVLAYFMLLPLTVGLIVAGWSGIGISLVAELTALWLWIIFHELTNFSSRQNPKISRTMSRIVGFGRNHLAVWITALAVPCFWLVRLTEVIVYPPLTWLIGLPKYQTKEWINVSRHKFEGLIGYDLIWCLYCDWMTGVWSLGTEMLRNVESFWCPIRFYEDKKCENCQLDFPDIDNGWVAREGKMEDVVELLDCKYAHTKEHSWFGHQSRLSATQVNKPIQ